MAEKGKTKRTLSSDVQSAKLETLIILIPVYFIVHMGHHKAHASL